MWFLLIRTHETSVKGHHPKWWKRVCFGNYHVRENSIAATHLAFFKTRKATV
jgi:hypothetical protein